MSPRLAVLSTLFLMASARSIAGQTDYANPDAGHPLRFDDARTIERNAVEWQLGAISRLRSRASASHLLHPQVAYGIADRTQVEIASDISVSGSRGVTALEARLLYAFNTESEDWPGLAVAVSGATPIGESNSRSTALVRGIVTRSLSWGRVHANLDAALSREAGAPGWSAGAAVDRTLVLRSLLVAAEGWLEPSGGDRRAGWGVGAGLRAQLTPRGSMSFGVRYAEAAEPGWVVTVSLARAAGIRRFLPGAVR